MISTAKSEATNVRLRHAVVEDAAFLLRLFMATQPIETKVWNMSATAREQLLEMQFRGRSRSYISLYPDEEDLILCLDEGNILKPIGRHLVVRQNDAILGIDLAIFPEHQGQGIGRRVLEEVQHQCALEGLRFKLQVLHTNPARKLYQRPGFTIVSQDLLYAQMEWHALQL